MAVGTKWFLHMLLELQLLYVIIATVPHRKFEYKYSFKPLYLAQKDGSVPFWEYGGNAIASSENVRLAPSLRSQKGAIWTKSPIDFDWWEIDLVFRVTGRGRIGADGLAFWYTNPRGSYNGSVFGSSDQWIGLGVFFDSFDNDNKHNNPYVMAIVNDGRKMFDHANDGATQLLNGCLRDFRNKPFPTRARIEYYQNTLTLLFHGGMTNNVDDFEICFKVKDVVLPKFGYFGVSAATGGLADDHDVLHFLTTSLHSPDQVDVQNKLPSEEENKFSQEYKIYQKKLEQEKEDYQRDNPEKANGREELEDWFEYDSQRELRQIFSGQSQAFEAIRSLSNKLDEIIGRQERTLGLLSQIQNQGAQLKLTERHQQPEVTAESIRRQEADSLIDKQNVITIAVHDLKVIVSDIQSKVDTIISNQIRNPTAQVQAVNYDYQTFSAEMRDGLNILKREISQTNVKIDNIHKNCSFNCLSTLLFLIVIALQTVFVLIYITYRRNKDTQAKKFY